MDFHRMTIRVPNAASVTLCAFLIAGCAPATLSKGPSAGHLRTEEAANAENVARESAIPAPVMQTLPLPRPKNIDKTETYSVVVNNVKAQDLLFALARDARLNVDIHPGIVGSVTLNAIDQTLPQLLTRIARQVDMRFELDGPNLVVMPDSPFLTYYHVDYVNLAREVTGTIWTNMQISSSALEASVGSRSGNVSRIQIDNTSKNRFWESLEKNLKDLLLETDKLFPEGSYEATIGQNAGYRTSGAEAAYAGSAIDMNGPIPGMTEFNGQTNLMNQAATRRNGEAVEKRMTFREAASVIINPETGVIAVRATSRQQEKVREFIERVTRSARRQVMIEATIIEVDLSDSYQQGIEWSKLFDRTGFSLIPAANAQSAGANVSPFSLTYRNASRGLEAILAMLRGFGTTKVLSSPKLTVLNNQTATLKVSEDFVYFKVDQSIAAGNSNTDAVTSTTTTPQSVSIGFFMNLTAQVGDDDMITLNVRPSISSISALKQDPNPVLTVVNEVPQIRTREIESMMRVHSGDIAVLGGLMEDRMENRSGRFPVIGDIPLVGELFTTRSDISRKSELVIVLRPTVIRDASIDADFDALAGTLPDDDFFAMNRVYVPLSGPGATWEPLR
ncbi:MAG: pilus (MSHA type) biogenesis protein MshL [Candidatus Accumulibacter sp.]|jgi:general secretion pathway protein D|nr:pilus (MSHA type) biogenesis protein MshL [Accumulibacter sp.]